jgi:hypothetical protein
MVTPEEQAVEALQQMESATNSASAAQDIFSGVLDKSSSALRSLNDMAKSSGISLTNLGSIAARQSDAFGILGAGVIKARDNFQSFGAIDLKNIPTFSGQVGDLKQALDSGGTAASEAKKHMLDMATKLYGATTATKMMAEAAKGGVAGLTALGSNMLNNADNALKMQASFIGLSASTGNLGNIYDKAGHNLTNMNSIIDTQNAMMDHSQAATNSTAEQMNNYYMTLGKVPKALEEVVTSTGRAGGTMSMLTATIKLAHGTGRNYEEVVKDLHQSFKDYGLVGESALKFTARFSELANSTGVELEDMRSGLMGATGAFKDLTDAGASAHTMTEGVSGIMKDYVNGLKEAGMTGAHAVDTVKNMAGAMAGLKVEQRAFLSGQTGGPGGLMGAAQIEKMIRSGDIEGVQKKVMETLKKQFGKVVTLDEATQSESAAAQRQKQVMLLQQGPLGAMAKTPEDAGRLLDAMAKGKVGKEGMAGLDPKGLSKSIDAGTAIEEKSHTQLSVISADISAMRHRLETANLGTIQKAFSTSAGVPDTATGANARMKESQQNRMSLGAQKSGNLTGEYGTQLRTKGAELADKRSENIKDSLGNIVDSVKRIPDSIRSVGQLMGPGGVGKKEEQVMDAKKEVQKSKLPDQAKAFKLPSNSSMDPNDPDFGKPVSPGKVLGAAPRGKASKKQDAVAPNRNIVPEVVVNQDPDSRFKFEVNIKATDQGNQANAINPAPSP